MRTALNSLAPLTAIPVRLSADFLSLDAGVSQVVVSGSVDVATLPFVRRPDRRQATVESVALVYDEAGAVVATLPTERSAMDLSDADYEQAPARRASRTRRRSLSRPAGTRCASRPARTPRGSWAARGSGSRSRISPRGGWPSAASSS